MTIVLGRANSVRVGVGVLLGTGPPPLVHHLEKADEIRFPGPVHSDEDVERAEFDLRVPDRLPPGESQVGKLCHFTFPFCDVLELRQAQLD